MNASRSPRRRSAAPSTRRSCATGCSTSGGTRPRRATVAGIDIVESITLRDDPLLLLALVQTRFATGTHELYQLPLALAPRTRTDVPRGESIAHTDEWTVYDALAEPTQALELLRRIETTDEIATADGHVQLPPVRRRRATLSDGDRRPADGRRAVELLDRVRRQRSC